MVKNIKKNLLINCQFSTVPCTFLSFKFCPQSYPGKSTLTVFPRLKFFSAIQYSVMFSCNRNTLPLCVTCCTSTSHVFSLFTLSCCHLIVASMSCQIRMKKDAHSTLLPTILCHSSLICFGKNSKIYIFLSIPFSL